MSNRRSGFRASLAMAAMMLPASAMVEPAARIPRAYQSPIIYADRRKGKNRKKLGHSKPRKRLLPWDDRKTREQKLINSMTNWQRHQWSKAFGKLSKLRADRMKIKTLTHYANLARTL